MSHSKPEVSKGSGSFAELAPFNVPVLAERYDRFCTHCSVVIGNLALEKYPNQKCTTCNHGTFLEEGDEIWQPCVRCSCFLKCTMQYCYMCKRVNPFYDSDKPARLNRRNEGKLRSSIQRQLQDEVTKRTTMEDKEEQGKGPAVTVDDLTNSCVEADEFVSEAEKSSEFSNK